MAERRTHPVPWMAGLVLVPLTAGGVGAWLLWWAANLLVEVNHFYTGYVGGDIDADVGLYYNRIASNAYSMQAIASPLLAGAVFAALALLTVLARRWDLRRR